MERFMMYRMEVELLAEWRYGYKNSYGHSRFIGLLKKSLMKRMYRQARSRIAKPKKTR
jgi:hypothetical protein